MAYIAERYAPLLSKDDTIELFEKLQQLCGGNLSEACRRCGIQRKTRYDWASARSIKLTTKKKILKAMLEIDMELTLSFLLSRSKEITLELLSTYMSYLYSEAMKEIFDPRYFLRILEKFERVKNDYAGLIWQLGEEVEEMTYNLREKARALRVPLPEESIDAIRPTHLLEVLPSVIHAVTRNIMVEPAKLAANLEVPRKLVQVVSEAISTTIGRQQISEAGKVDIDTGIERRPPTADLPTTATAYMPPPEMPSPWNLKEMQLNENPRGI